MNALILTAGSLCSILVLVAGCGQAGPTDGPQQYASGADQALVLAPGVTVSSGTYRITGPNDFSSAGTVAIGDSADVSVPVSGLPPGSPYQMGVQAMASDGNTLCRGSTPFAVPSSGSVTVVVHLTCMPTGDVQVTAIANVCPILDSLEANPAEVRIGGSMVLNAAAHDPDNGPSPTSYKWSANGAALPGQTQPTLTFTCTSTGSVAIRAGVFDGDPNCNDNLIANLTCSP